MSNLKDRIEKYKPKSAGSSTISGVIRIPSRFLGWVASLRIEQGWLDPQSPPKPVRRMSRSAIANIIVYGVGLFLIVQPWFFMIALGWIGIVVVPYTLIRLWFWLRGSQPRDYSAAQVKGRLSKVFGEVPYGSGGTAKGRLEETVAADRADMRGKPIRAARALFGLLGQSEAQPETGDEGLRGVAAILALPVRIIRGIARWLFGGGQRSQAAPATPGVGDAAGVAEVQARVGDGDLGGGGCFFWWWWTWRVLWILLIMVVIGAIAIYVPCGLPIDGLLIMGFLIIRWATSQREPEEMEFILQDGSIRPVLVIKFSRWWILFQGLNPLTWLKLGRWRTLAADDILLVDQKRYPVWSGTTYDEDVTPLLMFDKAKRDPTVSLVSVIFRFFGLTKHVWGRVMIFGKDRNDSLFDVHGADNPGEVGRQLVLLGWNAAAADEEKMVELTARGVRMGFEGLVRVEPQEEE